MNWIPITQLPVNEGHCRNKKVLLFLKHKYPRGSTEHTNKNTKCVIGTWRSVKKVFKYSRWLQKYYTATHYTEILPPAPEGPTITVVTYA